LAGDCGLSAATPLDEALTALDAHLCDLAETPIRDGLHIFGIAPAAELKAVFAEEIARTTGASLDDIAARLDASAEQERASLLAALDGRFVPPGPSGSPARGHLDVLPTGRNLITLDPRAVPTRAATELGTRAAAEVVRRHLQDTGDWPRRILMDLWASPTMRSGGEDLAHILALMGVRPIWDHASTRVTGFEIVPLPLLEGPRVDVTVRISGAFRDTFPAQIALLDQAARAVAALEEEDEWNGLAAARRRGEPLARIFGAPPGRYGAGVAATALDGDWSNRAELGAAYLAATTHAYGGPEGTAVVDGSYGARLAEAEAFVHVTDTPDRDILDGDDTAESIGGFASALGRPVPLYSLDTSRPERPRARTLEEDIARLVRGRLATPRWIEGQLRHGYSGAAELAAAVDSLFLFAATTRAVSDGQFDLVFEAFVADEPTYERLCASNPKAAAGIVARFEEARERGLWTSRRNSIALRLLELKPVPEAAE
jgi:cobaltochelatase CobN